MLYSLIRYLKPRKVLEIGAGYTSIFILQALADNAKEEAEFRDLRNKGECNCDGIPWSVDEYFDDEVRPAVLDCVDNMEHESTTAHLVVKIADELKLSSYLKLHVADCYDYDTSNFGDSPFDFVWLDGISTDKRFAALFKRYFAKIRLGGYAAVHSTLTNSTSKIWLSTIFGEQEAEAQVPFRYEIKPWGVETQIEKLEGDIRTDMVDGIHWCEGYSVEDIAFGMKKLVMKGRVGGGEAAAWAIADAIAEKFPDVSSADMCEGEDSLNTQGWGSDLRHFGFREPHKRFQNSFSLFQKRGNGDYQEPTFSWSP